MPAPLPGWVGPASRVIIALQRVGVAFLSFHVLRVRGRKSGLVRTTVVSPFEVEGRRYILSFGELEWVRNVRVDGRSTLGRGRSQAAVVLVEVKPPASARVAAEFPRQVPAGVRFLVRSGLVEAPGRPDQFAAAAANLAVFRIDPASPQPAG